MDTSKAQALSFRAQRGISFLAGQAPQIPLCARNDKRLRNCEYDQQSRLTAESARTGMTMKKRLHLVALFLSLSLPWLLAQTPGDVPATREDVMKLFATMKIHDQMQLVMDSVMKQQRAMLHDTMRKRSPHITNEEMARLDQFTSDIMKDMPFDSLLDDMIPVYQKHLTRADVEAMNVFYSSPTGQKLLHEMPAMTAESMQAAGPHMQAMIDKIMDRAEQMADEEQQKRHESARPATEKN
jgi:uncharacterized protein